MNVPVWVIDTNVLVSAALTRGGTCDQLLQAVVDGRFRMAWTAAILAEYGEVLRRPRFQLSRESVDALVQAFRPADQVVPRSGCPVLPDPDDGKFLAAALATPDKMIVTGNLVHFPVEVCWPVGVVDPRQALQILSGSA